MCLYPRLIENRKYRANKKNGGVIPPKKDHRVTWVAVGCQICIECRKQKAREWMTRLQEDIKDNTNGKFITLTFSTKGLKEIIFGSYKIWKIKKKVKHRKPKGPRTWKKPKLNSKKLTQKGYDLDNAICTKAMRLFLERWRKKYGKSLRHWVVTELGDGHSEHVHMHGIVWTDNLDEIQNIWSYGNVWRGYLKNGKYENYVSARTVNYMVKYVSKIDKMHMNYKCIILTSAGIGNRYTKKGNYRQNKFKGNETDETYKTSTGHKIAMPSYWRNKIYSEDEREMLWINKLDKEERWICGEKIDTKSGYDGYYNILEYHRQRTKKLGYPEPKHVWSKKAYEEQRRRMLQEKRLEVEGWI